MGEEYLDAEGLLIAMNLMAPSEGSVFARLQSNFLVIRCIKLANRSDQTVRVAVHNGLVKTSDVESAYRKLDIWFP